jgi:predicted transcriptional regulator
MRKSGLDYYWIRKMMIGIIIILTLGFIIGVCSISGVAKDSEFGNINGNWTWSGNFILEKNFVVSETDILTIEPGANIQFKNGATLKIMGTLYANGTPELPINLNGVLDYSGYTDNGGTISSYLNPESWLVFSNDTSNQSIINNTFIKSLGLRIQCSFIMISNCHISNNSRLEIEGLCSPTISNNIFRDNGIGEPKQPWYYSPYKYKSWSMSSMPTILCSYGTTAIITNNIIVHNGGFGLNINSASPWVENNSILENRQGGIHIEYTWWDCTSNPIIIGNIIANHGKPIQRCDPPGSENIYPSITCPVGVYIEDSNASFYNNNISSNEIGIHVSGRYKGTPRFFNDLISNNAFGIYSYDSSPVFQDCFLNNIAYDFWLEIYSHIKAYNTTFDENKIYIEETSKLETDNKIYYPIIGGLTITGIIICLFFSATELGKYKFFTIFFPLYSKLKHEKILDQFVRGQIYGLIRGEPGIYYSKIKKILKVGNGKLAYHLSVLEREGFVKSKRSKLHKKFFPIKLSVKFTELEKKYPKGEEIEEGIKLSDLQEKILALIKDNPGITQTIIASKLDTPKQTVSYNVKNLARNDIIDIIRDANQTKCYFKDVIEVKT